MKSVELDGQVGRGYRVIGVIMVIQIVQVVQKVQVVRVMKMCFKKINGFHCHQIIKES